MEGSPLLETGWAILEVKVQGALPLWLAEALSRAQVYKTSFSKYGEAYRQQLMKEKTFALRAPALFGVA